MSHRGRDRDRDSDRDRDRVMYVVCYVLQLTGYLPTSLSLLLTLYFRRTFLLVHLNSPDNSSNNVNCTFVLASSILILSQQRKYYRDFVPPLLQYHTIQNLYLHKMKV